MDHYSPLKSGRDISGLSDNPRPLPKPVIPRPLRNIEATHVPSNVNVLSVSEPFSFSKPTVPNPPRSRLGSQVLPVARPASISRAGIDNSSSSVAPALLVCQSRKSGLKDRSFRQASSTPSGYNAGNHRQRNIKRMPGNTSNSFQGDAQHYAHGHINQRPILRRSAPYQQYQPDVKDYSNPLSYPNEESIHTTGHRDLGGHVHGDSGRSFPSSHPLAPSPIPTTTRSKFCHPSSAYSSVTEGSSIHGKNFIYDNFPQPPQSIDFPSVSSQSQQSQFFGRVLDRNCESPSKVRNTTTPAWRNRHIREYTFHGGPDNQTTHFTGEQVMSALAADVANLATQNEEATRPNAASFPTNNWPKEHRSTLTSEMRNKMLQDSPVRSPHFANDERRTGDGVIIPRFVKSPLFNLAIAEEERLKAGAQKEDMPDSPRRGEREALLKPEGQKKQPVSEQPPEKEEKCGKSTEDDNDSEDDEWLKIDVSHFDGGIIETEVGVGE